MADSESGISLVQVLTFIVPSVIALFCIYFAYYLKHKTAKIIVRQNISRVIDPKMSPRPIIVFQAVNKSHQYKNLFIVDAHFFNRSMQSFKKFDLTVKTKINADIIFAVCIGHDECHKAVETTDVSFDNPLKVVKFDLMPLNKNKPYTLTLYITCPAGEKQNLTGLDMNYTSQEDADFIPEQLIPISLFNIKYHGKFRRKNTE